MDSNVILLTGGTGFIGKNLCQRLVKNQWEVHLIIRPTSDITVLKKLCGHINLHYYDGSINSMNEIFKTVNPKIVVHLATYYSSEHNFEDIDKFLTSNIKLGTHLLEAMINNNNFNLINTGTTWQHYNNEEYNPVNLYAATKQAFDSIIKYYIEASNLKVLTLKLTDTYGPNDERKKIFNLFKKAMNDSIPLYMSPGDQLLNLVYIDDVIDAFIIAIDRMNHNNMVKAMEEYTILNPELISLKKLVEVYEKIYKQRLPIVFGGRPYKDREVMIPFSGGEKLPKWNPDKSIEAGIRLIKNQERN